MTTSKTGAGSAIADASFRPIVGRTTSPYRLLGRGAISFRGFRVFKGLRRPVKRYSFVSNFKWLSYKQ
jgi:hypothetical protein